VGVAPIHRCTEQDIREQGQGAEFSQLWRDFMEDDKGRSSKLVFAIN